MTGDRSLPEAPSLKYADAIVDQVDESDRRLVT